MSRELREGLCSVVSRPAYLSTRVLGVASGLTERVDIGNAINASDEPPHRVCPNGRGIEIVPAIKKPGSFMRIVHVLGADAVTFQSESWSTTQPPWKVQLREVGEALFPSDVLSSLPQRTGPDRYGLLAREIVTHSSVSVDAAA